MSDNIQNIALRPQKVFIGVDRPQIQKIVFRADTEDAPLAGRWFLFQDPAGAKHICWLDDGVVSDPDPAGGWTLHAVTITEGMSATAMAAAAATILGAITGFDATSVGAELTLTCTEDGPANPARDATGNAATGFDFSVSQMGSLETEAGCITGDISLSGLTPDEVDIQCHDKGTSILGRLVTGYPPLEVSMSFQETDKASLKQKFIAAGQYPVLPIGPDATEVFGYGSAALFKAIPNTQLRLHPVGKADSDRSMDWTFWKSRLVFDETTFSGENVMALPVTFTVFEDNTKLPEISFFMIGDSTQVGLTVAENPAVDA